MWNYLTNIISVVAVQDHESVKSKPASSVRSTTARSSILKAVDSGTSSVTWRGSSSWRGSGNRSAPTVHNRDCGDEARHSQHMKDANFDFSKNKLGEVGPSLLISAI